MSKIHRRFNLSPPKVERREEGGVSLPVMTGYPVVFNQWTELYRGKYLTVREIVRPGAFLDALSEGADVVLNFNHDKNFVLARTVSNTLRLVEDSTGLKAEGEILDSQRNRDWVIDPASRGDLRGMSFAFFPRENGYKETRRETDDMIEYEYELTSANLYDVSIVTNPAYGGTSFDIRSGVDFSEREKAERLDFETRRNRKTFLMRSALALAELGS